MYTKGEWRIVPDTSTAINCGKKHIAYVNYFRSESKEKDITIEEHQDNAKLIAASPLLLEACKDMLHSMAHEGTPHRGRVAESVVNMQDAIKKATGE